MPEFPIGGRGGGTGTIIPPSPLPVLNPAPAATGPGANIFPQPGLVNLVSHSWGAGQNLQQMIRGKAGWISKLVGMLGINNDFDLTVMCKSGQAVSGIGGYLGSGWDSNLIWFVPANTSGYTDANTIGMGITNNQPYPTHSQPPTFFLHGINDPAQGSVANWLTAGVNAWKHALRTCISRYLAGTVYLANDPTIAYSGWTPASGQANCTGGRLATATVNASTITITLPANWPGGVIALCFQGSIPADASVYGINWSGTVSSMAGATALPLAAQGFITGSPVGVVKRFNTLSTDAGKTIVATLNITSGTPTATFDSWWREADIQAPVLIANVPRFNYASNYSMNDPLVNTPAQNAATAAVIAEFNVAANSPNGVAAPVGLVDIDTLLAQRSATIASAITTAGQTVVNVTTNGAYFGWQPGYALNVGISNPLGGVTPESLFVTKVTLHGSGTQLTGPVPAGTSLDVTVIRSANGSAALTSVTVGQWVADATWFMSTSSPLTTAIGTWDNIHMNEVGYSFIANAFYQAYISLLSAAGGSTGVASIPSISLKAAQNPTGKYVDGAFWYVPTNAPLSTVQPANAVVNAVPIHVREPIIITGMGVEVVTGGGAGSLTRLCVFENSGAGLRPTDSLIQDFGTFSSVTAGATVAQGITGLFQRLLPGWYWLGVVTQATPAPLPIYRSITALDGVALSNQAILGAAGASACGYSGGFPQTAGVAIPVWTFGGWGGNSITNAPRVWLQIRALMFDGV